MSFKLSARSKKRLLGVHPDLIRVVVRAIEVTTVDFSVVEGVRSLAMQKRYFEMGKSRTMNSRHLLSKVDGFGHAVDLAPWVNGTIEWEDPAGFTAVADAVKAAATECEVPVQWGYDLWRWDMPHFQLPKALYP